MKALKLLCAASTLMVFTACQEEMRSVQMITSTMDSPWQTVLDMEVPMFDLDLTMGVGDSTLVIDPLAFQQTIEGSTAEQRLYELIWKRTIASQMADAIIEKTTAEISILGDKRWRL